jgi:cysteine-rich repeat protein
MRFLACSLAAVLAPGCYSSSSLGGAADASTDRGADRVGPGTCGNGVVDEGEGCDDGDDDDCDGCTRLCEPELAMHVEHDMPGATVDADVAPCVTCPFTVEAWFRSDDYERMVPIVEQEGTMGLAAGLVFFEFYAAYFVSASWHGGVLEPGEWHHAALVCFHDEEGWWLSAFADGVTTGGIGGLPGPTPWGCDEPLYIAHAIGSDPDAYVGTLDDLRISSECLYEWSPDGFVPERYLGVRPDTVALWDFDRVVDGVIPDISGNGYDARLGSGRLVADGCHLP